MDNCPGQGPDVDFCVDGNETLVSIRRGIFRLAQRVLTSHRGFCL